MPNVSEKVIFSGDEYGTSLVELIQNSKSEICLSTYILEDDEFGGKIFRLLQDRAAAGVNVRIIVDGYGSLAWIQKNYQQLVAKNFEVRIFHPLPLSVRILQSDLPRFNRIYQYLVHINRRNHQKLFIFDSSVVMTGSRNVNDSALNWRETTLIIRGNPIAEFVAVFEEIWARAHDSFFKNVYRKRKFKFFRSFTNVYSNHLFLLRRNIRLMLQKKISQAQSEICITTPYFMPPQKLLRFLCKRSKAGVRVHILLPKTTDVPLSKLAAEISYEWLLKCGIRIYEYDDKILHAKSMIIDNWVFVGSSNLNRRSLLRDLELDYVVEQPETIQKIKDQFWIDVKKSTEITSAPKVFFIKMFFMRVIRRIFASWF